MKPAANKATNHHQPPPTHHQPPPTATPPQKKVKPNLLRVEVGVKTRQQLTSERAILETMIAAAVGACGDERLAEKAKPFARGLCRHFAMLYAAGAAPPPAPPATSRPPVDPTAPKAADPVRFFLPSLVSLSSRGLDSFKALFHTNPSPTHPSPTHPSPTHHPHLTPTPTNHPQASPEPMPRGLIEFDVHVVLDALVEVLRDASPARATAAVENLSVLVTTTLRLHEVGSASRLRFPACVFGAGCKYLAQPPPPSLVSTS
jgi:hypothetical protein